MSVSGITQPLAPTTRKNKTVHLIGIHSAQLTAVPLWEDIETMTEILRMAFFEDVLIVQVGERLSYLSSECYFFAFQVSRPNHFLKSTVNKIYPINQLLWS